MNLKLEIGKPGAVDEVLSAAAAKAADAVQAFASEHGRELR